jgi:DNA-binding response OmpR family regulator
MGERFLEGEDPDSKKPAEARRWASLYGDMVDLKTQLLGSVFRQLPQLPKVARQELEGDIRLLETQRSRYRRRLHFWSERESDLAGIQIDDERMAVVHGSRRAALTSREFEIMSMLLSRPGEPFSADDLVGERLAEDTKDSTTILQTVLGELRRKLSDLDAPCEIVSVGDRGYAVVFRS